MVPTDDGDAGAGALYDVTGTFLMAIVTPIALDKPIQFVAHNTFTAGSDGGTLRIRYQPLSVPAPGQPRALVGTEKDTGAAPVNDEGKFTMDLGTQTVVGAANPISGSDITASLLLSGTIRSADRVCGSVAGAVTAPVQLDLAGSRWGSIRIDAGTVGTNALPEPDVSCAATNVPPPPACIPDAGAPDSGIGPDGCTGQQRTNCNKYGCDCCNEVCKGGFCP